MVQHQLLIVGCVLLFGGCGIGPTKLVTTYPPQFEPWVIEYSLYQILDGAVEKEPAGTLVDSLSVFEASDSRSFSRTLDMSVKAVKDHRTSHQIDVVSSTMSGKNLGLMGFSDEMAVIRLESGIEDSSSHRHEGEVKWNSTRRRTEIHAMVNDEPKIIQVDNQPASSLIVLHFVLNADTAVHDQAVLAYFNVATMQVEEQWIKWMRTEPNGWKLFQLENHRGDLQRGGRPRDFWWVEDSEKVVVGTEISGKLLKSTQSLDKIPGFVFDTLKQLVK